MTATSHIILPAPLAPAPAPAFSLSQDEQGFSFGDLLDIINPLHHLPVVSTLYRALTGDTIGDAEKVAGDGLYGGLIGLGTSIADLVVRNLTGSTVGDTVLNFAENLTGLHLSHDGDSSAGPPILANPQMLVAMQAVPPSLDTAGNQPVSQPAPISSDSQMLAALTRSPPSLQPMASSAAQDPMPASVPMLTDRTTFLAKAAAQGADPALAMRALQAYGKTLGLNS